MPPIMLMALLVDVGWLNLNLKKKHGIFIYFRNYVIMYSYINILYSVAINSFDLRNGN